MGKRTISEADVDRVWAAWLARQARPGACRYTEDRKKLIRKRLALGYSADDLVLLVRFAWEADAPGPRWWRGENPDARTYLDLDNLLRESKLGPRVQAASEWLDGLGGDGPGPGPEPAASRAPEAPRAVYGRPGHAGDPLVTVADTGRWRS